MQTQASKPSEMPAVILISVPCVLFAEKAPFSATLPVLGLPWFWHLVVGHSRPALNFTLSTGIALPNPLSSRFFTPLHVNRRFPHVLCSRIANTLSLQKNTVFSRSKLVSGLYIYPDATPVGLRTKPTAPTTYAGGITDAKVVRPFVCGWSCRNYSLLTS